MNISIPVTTIDSRRVFTSLLLAFSIVITPIAAVAGTQRARVKGQSVKTKVDDRMKTNVAAKDVFVNPPAPVAPPIGSVTATMTGTITTDVDSDSKADPGVDTITYTTTITNNTGADISGLQFTDTVDPHTTIISGSAVAAGDDAYSTIGNVKIDVPLASGVLANDFNPNTGNNTGMTVVTYGINGNDATSLVSNSPTTPTAQGGTVSVNTDGSFTYDPATGFTGTDTFKYASNQSGSKAIATVRITITGRIWFINNAGGACTSNCDGRLSHPFTGGTALANFQAINDNAVALTHAKIGDSIFIYQSGIGYTGPVTLLNNQKLIGQDSTASLITITGLTQPSGTDPLPAMDTGGSVATINASASNGINLGQGNTIRGLTISGTTGAKISGTNFGTVTVGNNTTPDVTLNGSGQALNLVNGSFAAASGLASVAVTSTAASTSGLTLNNVSVVGGGTVSFGSTTITSATTQGVFVVNCTVANSCSGTIDFGNTSVGVSGTIGADAIRLDTNSAGTSNFGTLTIANTSGFGFLATGGGGNSTISGAATITSANSGVTMQSEASGQTINFAGGANVTTTGSGNAGVLTSTSNVGTLTFSALTVQTNAGAGMNLSSGGTINVTNGTGTINNTAQAAAAVIANGVALNGNFASINSSGGTNGVSLTTVTGTSNFGTGALSGSGATFLVSGGTESVTYNGTIVQGNANPAVSITGHGTGTFTFGGNISGSVDGADLFFDNADGTYNFNATNTFTGGAGINITNGSGGAFSFSGNTSVTNGLVGANNACFVANGSSAGVTYSGNLTKNAASAGLLVDVTTEASGTITFQTGTLSSTSSSGTGINLNNADGTVNFNGTTTLNGGNAHVDINTGATGTFGFTNGAAITNPSGTAFSVNASGPSITYAGTITQNTAGQKAINVAGNTGGTSTFSGAITSDGGTGISLAGTGGTFTLSGQLTLNNTASVFSASGAGLTVNVTNANNTIGATNAVTSGTALSITSATIGASGVTFKSISQNGGTNGIVLSSTGTGSFTIAGDGGGSNNGSGGTIQNTTAEGVKTTTTGLISINYVNVTNAGTKGISVTGSTGVTINRCNVTDNAGGSTDIGLNLINNTGTITLSDDVVDSAPFEQAFIDNFNTNLTAISATNSTFKCTAGRTCDPSGSTGGDAFLVQIRGTSTLGSGNVDTCTFTGVRSTGVQVSATDTARIGLSSGGVITAPAANNSFVVKSSTFSNNNAGIDMDQSQHANITFQLLSNTLTFHKSSSINSQSGAGSGNSGTITGYINNNQIGTQGTKDSGSTSNGAGVRMVVQGDATQGYFTVDSNTIREVPNSDVIIAFTQNGDAVSGTGFARFKITNNILPQPSGTNIDLGCGPVGSHTPCGAADGNIFVFADEHNTNCALITGNQVFDATTMNGSWDVYLAARTGPPAGAAITVQTGAAGNSAAAIAFINANNTLNGANKSHDESGTSTAVVSCGSFPPLLLAEGGVMSALTAPSLISSLLGQSAGNTRCADNSAGLFAVDSKITDSSVNQQQLDRIVSAAIDRWSTAGLPNAQAAELQAMRFEVGTLSDKYLGEADGARIVVDRTAQGKGWFIDPTPRDDSEFGTKTSLTRRYTDPMNAAAGRVDLLTAIEHEMGHRLGLDDSYAAKDRDSIMYGYLTVGERRTPAFGEVKNAKPGAIVGVHHLTLGSDKRTEVRNQRSDAHHTRNSKLVTRHSRTSMTMAPLAGCATQGINAGGTAICVDIPNTLHNGESITISFQVTVNNPPNLSQLSPPQVSNSGAVSGSASATTNTVNTPVDLFDTTTSVGSSSPSSNQGDPVTFTATVAENPTQASADPSGTVQFLDGATPLTCSEGGVNGIRPVSGGTAACTTSAITPAGSPHTINANYSGDGNFDPSSGSVQQTVIACGANPVVTNTNDSGAGSLRDAITNICSSPNNNITFNIPNADPNHNLGVYTITLSTGEIPIAKNINITGPNSVTNTDPIVVSGGGVSRIFKVNSGITAVIDTLIMTNGLVSGASPGGNGGAIYNDHGTLTIKNSTVSGSTANPGGGIFNDGSTSGSATLTIINSTISGNTSNSDGGGVYNQGVSGGSATLTITNSTISGNTAKFSGGGVITDGTSGTASVTITNSTITNNRSDSDTNTVGDGGGLIILGGSTAVLRNSIVALNFKGGSPSTTANDIDGVVTAGGSSTHNLIGTCTDGCTLSTGIDNNTLGVTAGQLNLGTLQNNGGPVQTHALLAGSIAIEAGNNAYVVAPPFLNTSPITDARGTGFPRIADSADANTTATVDIGAYEAHPTVEDIGDKTTAEDTAIPQFSFNIGDGTGVLITSVTATSANTTLIPNANIVVGGSGSSRTLDISPAADRNSPSDGTATITVTVTASNGRTAKDTFVVTVTEVNDAPVPSSDAIGAIDEDCGSGCTAGKYVIPFATLLANDTNKGAANESGQTLTITGVSSPTGGTVAINGTNVEFTPTADFNGAAGFTYTATDDGTTNGVSDPQSGNAAVTFTINAVNDPPSFTKGADQTVTEDAGAQTVTNWATAISPGPANESGQTVSFNITGNTNTALFAVQPAVSSSGTLTYTPAANAFGTATITLTAQDNAGGNDTSAPQSFVINVTAVADTPSVTPNPASTNEDVQVTGLVVNRNASDGAEVTHFQITNILHGSLFTSGGTPISSGDFIDFATANAGLKFTPAADYNNAIGTAPSFDVQASTANNNTGLGGAVVTEVINVTAVNDAPSFTKGPDQNVVINAGAQTVPNWATSIATGPATATDETGQTLTFNVTGNTNPGLFSAAPAVSNTGTLTYTPTANTSGTATITLTLSDNGSNVAPNVNTSPSQTFTITVAQPALTVLDAVRAEPTSGTANMLFTVVLNPQLAAQTVTVDFGTASGGATPATSGTCGNPGVDYQPNSGTLTFQPGETMKTVKVGICSDNVNEPDETLLLNLSNANGATISRSQATGTIKQTNLAGTVIISEIRTSGPGGLGDDFVELYNNSDSPLTVTASDASAGYGLFKEGADCNATPVLIATIPNGTIIPARAHYLLVGSQYSLAAYAVGDQTLTSDIESDRNVAVFNTADVNNLSTVTRLDAVGFGTNSDGVTTGVCDLLREGTNLPAASGSTLEYTFFRKECDYQGSGCSVNGFPKDTNDNSADFLFADTQGTLTPMGQLLGAPGPQNKASGTQRNSTLAVPLLDSSISFSGVPNRARDNTPNTPNATVGPLGTLSIRRRIQNNTGGDVTALRFRIIDITGFPSAPGRADLRGVTSSDVAVSNIHDTTTCVDRTAGTASNCTVNVKGTTLDQPPNQTKGGGFNSSMRVDLSGLPGGKLAANQSVEIQLQFGVVQPGSFRIMVNVEDDVIGGDASKPGMTLATFSEQVAIPADQTITLNSVASHTFGDPDFTLAATASSGLPVAFSGTGNCLVTSDGSVHLTGAGTCTVTASQGGDAKTNPATAQMAFAIDKATAATTVTSSLVAAKLTQNVTFTANVVSPANTPLATGTVQFKDNGMNLGPALAVDANGSASFSTSALSAGTHTITADYSGNSNFNASTGTLASAQVVTNRPLISFATANYDVMQSDGFVRVLVNRNGDLSVPVTVDYSTDGSASGNCAALRGVASVRCDVTGMYGTFRFAAGETQKTLDIPINQDAYSQGPETFSVTLSNTTGTDAMLVTPATANVTINDAKSPTPNAIDDTTIFVRQQYHDFLNREPDASGLAFWKNNIDMCNTDATEAARYGGIAQCVDVKRVLTSAAFFLSIEFRGTGGLVRDFYVAALDRPASGNMPGFTEFERDTQAVQVGVVVGQNNWQQTLDANRTAFMKDFVMRPEFVGLYSTSDTPQQYVDKLYQHANVTPTNAQERLDAISEFGTAGAASDAGARGRALLRITQNAAFQGRELNRGFVQMQYFGYLRRNPIDEPDGLGGFDFWVGKLNEHNGDYIGAEMVKAFLAASEYRQRFGTP